MKTVYRLGDDFFIAVAFVTFVIGIILRLMEISEIGLGITPAMILYAAAMCLLFSIALSLCDLNQRMKSE